MVGLPPPPNIGHPNVNPSVASACT
jgi:hypothetical protein